MEDLQFIQYCLVIRASKCKPDSHIGKIAKRSLQYILLRGFADYCQQSQLQGLRVPFLNKLHSD